MQTTKLKRFATEARNKLRQGVANRLVILGFDEAGTPTVSPELVPGGAVWGEKPCTVAFYRGFKALEEQIRQYGVNHVVEEAAYTWFNRLMAIRILTMNGLCEPVLRYVGSTRTPLIVDEARQGHLPEMGEEDRKALMQLLDDDTKTAEQFALLISVFCHNTPIIEKCFSIMNNEYRIMNNGDDDTSNPDGRYSLYGINYSLDLLFPANLLTPEGFLDSLNSTDFISEEDYKSSELLGWLYQFYISEKKDQVFAKKGKYDADDIPAATQIFTPNWIVKYMVQNTILPQLMPADRIDREKYRYFVPSSSDTKHQIPNTKYRDLEEMRVADLACGSGHILNECFDLLYDLYISEGYTRREAIECIFCNNLTGIDIDTRAKQLATFALMLKACQREASLVDASLMPRVYDMSGMPEESRELGSIQIFDEPDSDNPVIAALSTHYDAIVMNPPYMPTNKIESLSAYINNHYKEGKADMFAGFMMVCMDRLKDGGRMGMINMQSWMFLSSFESLREMFLKEYTLSSMLHLGPRTFDELSGEVVQNTAFVFEKAEPNDSTNAVYYRLVDGKNCSDKEDMFLSNTNQFEISQSNFDKIPGAPIAYWVSEKVRETFTNNLPLSAVCKPTQGRATADNGRFVRSWFEVAVTSIGFGCASAAASVASGRKFFPYNKGGGFRRWYGNQEYVVNWENDGAEIKHFKGAVVRNPNTYFQSSISWGLIASQASAFRYYPKGFIYDVAGMSITYTEVNKFALLGSLNTKLFFKNVRVINPTVNMQCGDVAKSPNILPHDSRVIKSLSNECVSISKQDWDAHETSWDFEKNPLLAVDTETYMNNINAMIERHRQETGEELCVDPEAPQFGSLKWRYEQYKQKWENLFMKLHANEEELNRRFIEIYGLQDELTPDVPLNEITILQQGEVKVTDQYNLTGEDGSIFTDEKGNRLTVTGDTYLDWQADVVMKQFISYAVGCMMGRYRLDRPGLAIAHPNEAPEEVAEYQIPGTDEKFWIDTDGIIPLLPEDCGFHDNAANRLATFVRQVLGEESQTENLNFIEECLGKSIEQYFMKDFWKDHKKMYQNRPIYWLFSSKKGAFQVLVYVHRMNVASVERIRSRYLLPYIERLNKRIDDLQANESTLSTKQRNQLKTLRAQVDECSEYHNRLAVVAERGIIPNLDDGIPANHALFGDVVTKLK